MNSDRLDNIYSKLSQKEFEDILSQLDHNNNELFFMLYNSAPQDLCPPLSKDSYFTQRFCSRVETIKDENLFNDWFFNKNLKEFYDINELRKLTKERPQNKELSKLLEEKDKPKSMVEVLNALFYYRPKDKTKYLEIIEENKEKLFLLNTKKYSNKSTITQSLYDYLKKFTSEEKFQISKEMGLDLIKINNNSGTKSYMFSMEDTSLEDIKTMFIQTPGKDAQHKFNNFITLFTYSSSNYDFPFIGMVFEVLDNKKDQHKEEKAEFIFSCALPALEKYRNIPVKQIKEEIHYLICNINNEEMQEKCHDKSNHYINGSSQYTKDKFLKKIKTHQDGLLYCINPLFIKLGEEFKTVNKITKRLKI